MTICFATNNRHKVSEVQAILGKRFQLLTLDEAGIHEELAEDQDTLEGNSFQKAKYVFEKTNLPTFADDSGLIVAALNGAPGVYSARYGGAQRNDADNITLLLKNLSGKPDRSAYFKTVITWIYDHSTCQFEGVINGTILAERRGTGGFGYDPVFQPTGSDRSFAEMSEVEKNTISHRAIAVNHLIRFLQQGIMVSSGL